MPVSTPKYKNLFRQTLKKQVLIHGFLLYLMFLAASIIKLHITSAYVPPVQPLATFWIIVLEVNNC